MALLSNSTTDEERGVTMKRNQRDPLKKSLIQRSLIVIFDVLIILLLFMIGLSLYIAYGTRNNKSVKGFIVIPDGDIIFNPDDNSTYEKYISQLNEALKPYDDNHKENTVLCDNERPVGKICDFPITWLESCSDKHAFGFKESKPCILLTFKNNPDYNPVVFDNTTLLPENMPQELKNDIIEEYIEYENETDKQAWIYCNNASNYYPSQGFMSHYFPTQNIEGYLPPIVAVPIDLRFENEFYIECSLWSNSSTGKPDSTLSFRIQKKSS